MQISKEEYKTLVAKGLLPPETTKPKKKWHPYRSQWEQRFAWWLDDGKKSGLVSWWAYEAITLVVVDANGKKVRYTPDFVVIFPDQPSHPKNQVCCIEVKGHLRDAARIKFLAAKERYPFFHFRMLRRTQSGDWMDVPNV